MWHVLCCFVAGAGADAGAGATGATGAGAVVQTETPLRVLCQGFPSQMEEYLRYCRSLDFEARPDYNYLRGLFREVLVSKYDVNDTEYDWIKRKRQEREARQAEKSRQSRGASSARR